MIYVNIAYLLKAKISKIFSVMKANKFKRQNSIILFEIQSSRNPTIDSKRNIRLKKIFEAGVLLNKFFSPIKKKLAWLNNFLTHSSFNLMPQLTSISSSHPSHYLQKKKFSTKLFMLLILLSYRNSKRLLLLSPNEWITCSFMITFSFMIITLNFCVIVGDFSLTLFAEFLRSTKQSQTEAEKQTAQNMADQIQIKKTGYLLNFCF